MDSSPAIRLEDQGRQDETGSPPWLRALCDEGSLQLIRSRAESAQPARPGDGILAGTGRVAGRPVVCYAQDARVAGGSLGAAHAETILRLLRTARRAGAPVISFVESAGARMQEGLDSLDGYGRIFAEQVALRVPQLSVVLGAAAGGGAYGAALTDFVIMTRPASLFLTGPGVVEAVTGEAVSKAELGGPKVHARNGVSHLTVEDGLEAVALVRRLLSYLPGARLSLVADPAIPDPSACVPEDPRRVYDVRDVLAGIADAGSLLELAPRWAPNLLTAFARLGGQPVGVIANQPRRLGGVLDAAASEKGARFVGQCDTFGLPLVVLVDTPGFLPGTHQEAAGVIRHGAGLLRAFAGATVPRLTVVTRKAFGGAFIAMNSKGLGADLVLAWPRAQLGIVGAEQAVGIVARREIAASADPDRARRRLAADYAARHLTAEGAARGGHIDELIEPVETRERLLSALAVYQGSTRGLQ